MARTADTATTYKVKSIGGEETILAYRKIAANRLAIDCINALSKKELSKMDYPLTGLRNWAVSTIHFDFG